MTEEDSRRCPDCGFELERRERWVWDLVECSECDLGPSPDPVSDGRPLLLVAAIGSVLLGYSSSSGAVGMILVSSLSLVALSLLAVSLVPIWIRLGELVLRGIEELEELLSTDGDQEESDVDQEGAA